MLATLHKFKKKVCLPNHAQYNRVTNRTVIKKTLKGCNGYLQKFLDGLLLVSFFKINSDFPPTAMVNMDTYLLEVYTEI